MAGRSDPTKGNSGARKIRQPRILLLLCPGGLHRCGDRKGAPWLSLSGCGGDDCGAYTKAMRRLVGEHYPDACKVRVVALDNLNTHTPAALYEDFEAAVRSKRTVPASRREANTL